jgi:DNA (cytosine-5)-methyltransferase 1
MRYGSVCSGIEAASVAWEPLGWQPAWFSQFDPEHNYKRGPDFPSAVLAHHWPHVENLGDMTQIADMVRSGWAEAPDVLVGGTPCQAFSVAGLRGGLADGRGQLTLEFIRLANAIDEQREEPAIIVWENVPGVLSSKDNAFGCFLAGLAGESDPLVAPGGKWANAGCVLGPQRAVAWRILDAQYFGVAQRRRRVFVVASAGSEFDPTAVLFEFDGLRRDSAPSREAGKAVAALTAFGVGATGADDNQAQAGHLIPDTQQWPAEIASTLNACFGEKQGLEDQHVNGGCPLFVPSVAYSIRTANTSSNGWGLQKDVTHTLDTAQGLAVAIHENNRAELRESGINPTLSTGGGKPGQGYAAVREGMQVRRLTPVECERLQGFPDNHTLIPGRAADGPRYKALGNSMAVPVMHWIGARIYLHLLGFI